LRRLVRILIDNAFKYTNPSDSVRVDLFCTTGFIRLSVSDTGVGIVAEDLPHIFDLFFRADPSRSEIEGTGLGLAIAKWIADIHNGKINVESHEGEGTIFTFTLPMIKLA